MPDTDTDTERQIQRDRDTETETDTHTHARSTDQGASQKLPANIACPIQTPRHELHQQIEGNHLQKQNMDLCTLCISNKQMQASRTYVRKLGKTICRNSTPTLYMSNLSGLLRRHRMGDSKAATGRSGGGGWL